MKLPAMLTAPFARKAIRKQRPDLTVGPVAPLLRKQAVPLVFSFLSMVLFNLVDAFFVGQLGATQLAAMSFTFPVIMVVGALAISLGIGTAAVASHALGKKDDAEAARLTTGAMLLGTSLGLVLALIGYVSVDVLFPTMGVTSDAMPFVWDYLSIWYLGLPLVLLSPICNNAIRATGDTLTPSAIMIGSFALNLVLDPLLIFGLGPFPRMALEGAALATVLSRLLMAGSIFWVLKRRGNVSTEMPGLDTLWRIWKEILSISGPALVGQAAFPLSMFLITGIIATHGPEAVAAFGVGTRMESLAMIGITAISAALIPLVGQNRGAQKPERIRQIVSLSNRMSLLWGGAICLLFLILAKPVASLFSDDPKVVQYLTWFLYICPANYAFRGLIEVAAASFNAHKKGTYAAATTLLRMFVFYVPLAWLGSHLMGVKGIFIGASLAGVCSGIIAYFWLKSWLSPSLNCQPVAA